MKTTLMRLAVLVAACGGFAHLALAQTPPRPIRELDDPDARSIGTGSLSRVVIEAGDADGKASARLAKELKPTGTRYGRFSFTVTAPFDSKKADKVDIGTLSGLTAGTSAPRAIGAEIDAFIEVIGNPGELADIAVTHALPRTIKMAAAPGQTGNRGTTPMRVI